MRREGREERRGMRREGGEGREYHNTRVEPLFCFGVLMVDELGVAAHHSRVLTGQTHQQYTYDYH